MACLIQEEEVEGVDKPPCLVEKKTMDPLTSFSVPFKWEEAPGKPLPICNELTKGCPAASHPLQLPPKLQFQAHHHQHHSSESNLCQKSPHSMQPKNQKFMKLYKCMFRNASWSQPLHPQKSFVKQANESSFYDDQGHLVINDRFSFDKTSPQALKFSVSIDSWHPITPPYEERDGFLSGDPSLALDDEESTYSSPWHPIMFHDRESASSPWQPSMFHEREEQDDGLHFCTTPPSTEKPPQIAPFANEKPPQIAPFANEKPPQIAPFANDIVPPSAPPWCLDFSPDEEKPQNKAGRKNMIRLVVLIRFKNMIRKICKLKRKREANQADMWSPTLATYLYNQQKQKEEDSSHSVRSPHLSEDEKGDEHTWSIKGQSSLAMSSEEEQDEPQKFTHKFRLNHGEELAHNGDGNSSFSEQVGSSSVGDPSIDTKERVPAHKRIYKVSKTVGILATTIKLVFVQREGRGRRRASSFSHSCKPKFNLSPSSSRVDPSHS